MRNAYLLIMNIYIENETDIDFGLEDYKAVICSAVLAVAEGFGLPGALEVNVLITGLEQIRQINSDSRGIDSATDVLSFPYYDYETPGVFDGEIFEDEENILGDIILCAQKVTMQAAEYGHSRKRELSFLVVHSMLHLLGYDHIKDDDRIEMERQQRKYMEILGISR